MSKSLHVELSIPCLSEFVGVVRLAISGIATRMNFSVEDIEDIKIAVSEACTNSIQYAYPDQTGDQYFINIYVTLYSEKLEIIIKDTGKGFDVSQLEQQKHIEIHPDKLGLGLGITFIKSLMDEAYIESVIGQGTTVTMVKYSPAVEPSNV